MRLRRRRLAAAAGGGGFGGGGFGCELLLQVAAMLVLLSAGGAAGFGGGVGLSGSGVKRGAASLTSTVAAPAAASNGAALNHSVNSGTRSSIPPATRVPNFIFIFAPRRRYAFPTAPSGLYSKAPHCALPSVSCKRSKRRLDDDSLLIGDVNALLASTALSTSRRHSCGSVETSASDGRHAVAVMVALLAAQKRTT